MAENPGDSGEKTFAPTEKRRREAAKRGDVLRSKELTTAIGILVAAAWLQFAGPELFEGLGQTLRAGLMWDRASFENFAPDQILHAVIWQMLPPVLMLGGLIVAASVGSQIGLGDGAWVPDNLAPKASRLNPMSGLKRMFGPTGWIELAKGLAKLGLLGTIGYFWMKSRLDGLIGLGTGNLGQALRYSWDALIALVFALGGGLAIIALIDFPVQWLRRFMRLRMSHQEMRDEHKESEGSPELKNAIRQRQRKLSMGGVQKAMREAQFVITNPTHFSVALAYDPDKAAAPIVLAKGRGEKALAMRELAAELGVPTLEYPALARSVYFTTRENQVIREELYGAIAAVLAFVLSLKRGDTPAAPSIEVPITLRFDTDGRPEPAKNA